MTERGSSSLSRDQHRITVGPSSMHWDGGQLRIAIDEWTAPLPTRVRGAVTLHPEAINQNAFALDAQGRHHWRPIAPHARIDVRFDDGALAWSGDAYLDSNWGDEPLERGFRSWHWSRAHTNDATHIHYDVTAQDGAKRALALRFDASGSSEETEPQPAVAMPDTFWRVPRVARGAEMQLVRTLEDAPFYARSQLAGTIDGAPADIMHESLSLQRFRMPIVRAMLPFRMPRIVSG